MASACERQAGTRASAPAARRAMGTGEAVEFAPKRALRMPVKRTAMCTAVMVSSTANRRLEAVDMEVGAPSSAQAGAEHAYAARGGHMAIAMPVRYRKQRRKLPRLEGFFNHYSERPSIIDASSSHPPGNV